jgi:hypothetical protein
VEALLSVPLAKCGNVGTTITFITITAVAIITRNVTVKSLAIFLHIPDIPAHILAGKPAIWLEILRGFFFPPSKYRDITLN